MTTQRLDLLELEDGESYEIIWAPGPGLFDPADRGLNVVPLGSHAWRGYHCSYAIRDGQLYLMDLELALTPEDAERYQRLGSPLPGTTCEVVDAEFGRLWGRDLSWPWSYEGELVVGLDFLGDEDVPGSGSPNDWWAYAQSWQLELEGGRVTQQVDRSQTAAEERRRRTTELRGARRAEEGWDETEPTEPG